MILHFLVVFVETFSKQFHHTEEVNFLYKCVLSIVVKHHRHHHHRRCCCSSCPSGGSSCHSGTVCHPLEAVWRSCYVCKRKWGKVILSVQPILEFDRIKNLRRAFSKHPGLELGTSWARGRVRAQEGFLNFCAWPRHELGTKVRAHGWAWHLASLGGE